MEVRPVWFTILLMVLVCLFSWSTVSAIGSPADRDAEGYTVDGIDVYKNPAEASTHFNVEKLIYFTANGGNAPDDSRIVTVNTTDALIAAAKENPFAALVVDAGAEPLLNRDAVGQLSKTQHLILLIGFEVPREDDLAVYGELTGKPTEEYRDRPGFAACYVVPATGKIAVWDIMWGQDFTADELLSFAERTKEGTFFLYDSLVLETHPEWVEEINNAPVPAENIVMGYDRPLEERLANQLVSLCNRESLTARMPGWGTLCALFLCGGAR